jgi:hypothetical protein
MARKRLPSHVIAAMIAATIAIGICAAIAFYGPAKQIVQTEFRR